MALAAVGGPFRLGDPVRVERLPGSSTTLRFTPLPAGGLDEDSPHGLRVGHIAGSGQAWAKRLV
jgi:hypothetical protein